MKQARKIKASMEAQEEQRNAIEEATSERGAAEPAHGKIEALETENQQLKDALQKEADQNEALRKRIAEVEVTSEKYKGWLKRMKETLSQGLAEHRSEIQTYRDRLSRTDHLDGELEKQKARNLKLEAERGQLTEMRRFLQEGARRFRDDE